MLRCIVLSILCLALGAIGTKAQPWVKKLQDRSVNFYEVQRSFQEHWGNRPYRRGYGWKQYKRWEDFWENRVYPHGIRPPENFVWNQHLQFQQNHPTTRMTKNAQPQWSPMGPSSWTSAAHNPGQGRVNTVVEDPNNSNILYVGTPAGGCWKSTDAGATWQVLTDQLQSLGVSAIAIDYTNSDIIYLGTGDDDGGDTYSIGLIKSTDGGATWQNISPQTSSLFGTRMYRIILHPADPQTVLVASSSGCFKSTNGGINWTRLRSGHWKDMELHPTDPDIIYLSNRSFVRSTDGGTTWQTISTGLPGPSDINRAEIAVTPADSSNVYFVCGDPNNASFYGIYRSTNAGTSFTLQANSPNIFGYDLQGTNLTSGQSWYDLAIAVSPTNAEEVYVGGINVWKSIDGGQNWFIRSHWVYPSARAYTHADIHSLDFYGNRLYCGSDGGVFRSTNGGNRFQDLSAGLEISQYYRIDGTNADPGYIIGGTQDNGCNLTKNGKALHVSGGDGMEAWISEFDTLVMYASSQFGYFRRSVDGGHNFSPIFSNLGGNGAWVTPFAVHPQDNDYLVVGFDQVYVSLDGGNTETALSNLNWNGTIRHITLAPSAAYTHVYAATLNQIYMTPDGGTTWNNIKPGLPSSASISRIEVHPTNPLKIWVTFSGFDSHNKVFTSDDGGQNWTNITRNLPNIPVNCIVAGPRSDNAIYIGTDLGVYYTDTMTARWQPYMESLPNVIVQDLDVNNTIGKLRAGTYGRGIWEVDLRPPLSAPPIADFSYDAANLCVFDSVTFNDRSIDGESYWEWQFPGGTPSQSTAAQPRVNYPQAGIYQVTLIVRNRLGYDTTTQVVAINYSPNTVHLDIQLDNAPIDVSWTLFDNSGNQVTSRNLFHYNNRDSQLVREAACLEAGCYTLVMRDINSNGLCCTNGVGHYLLTNAQGDTLGMGSQYGATDTVNFCINQTRALQIGASADPIACGLANGHIRMVSIGGQGAIEYSLNGNPFQASGEFTNLTSGLYQIIGRDANGQMDTTTVQVVSAPPPVAVATASTQQVFLNQGGQVNFFSTNSTGAQQYLWKFADGSTDTQANPSYTFSGNSRVEPVILEVTKDGCTDTDTLQMTVTNNISVQTIASNIQFVATPNPVQEKVVITWSLSTDAPVTLVIHNAAGQRIYWQEFGAQQKETQIHLGNEPAGAYTVTLLSEGVALSKQLIKL